jgi:AcrR family transcriptional regulator
MNIHSAKSKKSPPSSGAKNLSVDEGKRERILRAALDVFARAGMDGSIVPEIARAADVGVGTLYRYFSNKEELVNEVFRDTKRKLKLRLTDGLDLGQAPRKLFDDFWRRLVAFALEEPQAFHFLELQDHIPYLDEESRNVELEVLAPIYLMCIEMQKQEIFNEALRPEVAMAMVWGAFVGLFKSKRNYSIDISKADLDSVRDACWRALTKPAKGR